MRILCVSDIHGHSQALAAVLATADKGGYTHFLAAGDHCFPGPDPLGTWRRLTTARAMCAQGATDRALATLDFDSLEPADPHERKRAERAREVRTELGDLILRQLAALPPVVRLDLPNGGELALMHGSPTDPLDVISHDLDDEEINALIGDDPADVFICGGSHVPFTRQIGDVWVVGVGSVGEALAGQGADADGQPLPAGHADAAIVLATPDGVAVEHLVVPLTHAA